MKTWLAGIALFAVLAVAAQAETVAGTVVDRSNRPVANATVTVTFASSAPLQTKTDAAGRFTVETTEPPAALTLRKNGFAWFTLSLAAVAPSVVADLRIRLDPQLVLIEEFRPRSVCGAFQPYQLWDRYDIVPGGPCGAPKH
jgi:hypothetical protein